MIVHGDEVAPQATAAGEEQALPRGPLFSAVAIALIFAAFVCIALVLHFRGFSSPMVYDGKEWIEGKTYLFAQHDLLGVIGIVPVRPLFMISLYANYVCAGMEPVYFRLVNAIVLATTAFVLMLLVRVIYDIPHLRVPGTGRHKQVVALFLAGWFLVHPLQTYVVLYIWQREAILACLFYYSALAVYLAMRSNRLRSPARGYILTAALFLAGLFSKENVVTLPVALILAEATLLRQSFRQLIRRALAISAICLPVLVVYFLVTAQLYSKESVHPAGAIARLYDHYATSGLSPLQVALTECRILISYVAGIVAPFFITLPFLTAETVSTSLYAPGVTSAAVIGVIAMLGTGIALLRKAPLISFGLLFFLIAIGPESALIPTYLFFGYRAILPMPGILLIVGWIVLELISFASVRMSPRWIKSVVPVALAIPLISMAAITCGQAERWAPLHFWLDGFARVPTPPGNVERIAYLDIVTGLGGELIDKGRYAEAIEVLKSVDRLTAEQKASEISADAGPPHTKHEEQKEAATSIARRDRSKIASAYLNLGLAYKRSGNIPEAVRQFNRVLESDPRSGAAYNNLANVWEESGDMPRALQTYAQGVDLNPNSANLHFNFACALSKVGKRTEALQHFEKAVALKPDYAQAQANLGVALLEVGRAGEAIEHLQRALVALKRNAELHNALGAALAEQGRTSEAAEHFKKALEIQPDHAGAQQNLRTLLK